MPASMRTTALAVGLVVGLTAGCEHGIDTSGTVEVPADVQALLSPEASGDVMVDIALREGSTRLRIGRACGGPSVVYEVDAFDFGCATETVDVITWVAPHDGALEEPPACDVAPAYPLEVQVSGEPGEGALARAAATVTVDRSGILSCKNGSLSFELVLEPL